MESKIVIKKTKRECPPFKGPKTTPKRNDQSTYFSSSFWYNNQFNLSYSSYLSSSLAVILFQHSLYSQLIVLGFSTIFTFTLPIQGPTIVYYFFISFLLPSASIVTMGWTLKIIASNIELFQNAKVMII